jgi:hypothetical protein
MAIDSLGGTVLHRRRKRLEELAALEAEGENFWSDEFDLAARTKIVLVVRKIAEMYYEGSTFLNRARDLILTDEGLFYLHERNVYAADDMLRYLMSASDEMMPTAIEALAAAFRDNRLRHASGGWDASEIFESTIAVILREHRIKFELIDGHMVEFSSRALHVDVVAPVLTLLGGDKKWASTEKAFQDALEELSKGEAGDAITDAGTALQEVLTALGCTGNALGPLIKSARSSGKIAPHDSPLLDSVERVMHWVSADRSEKGDAHTSAMPTLDDAWFTVHVVGAIILRLTKPGPRA